MQNKNISHNKKISNYEYNLLVEDLITKVEKRLDFFIDNYHNLEYYHDIDIDYYYNNQVFTIKNRNKTLVIINRQSALKEIWLATHNQGYHFYYHYNSWICKKTKNNFWNILEKYFYEEYKINIFQCYLT